MTPAGLYAVVEATWPPAARSQVGPWIIRDGQGGGKRVSAATAAGDWSQDDLAEAEAAMQALGQDPLFMIRAGEDRLDVALADRGYRVVDPVVGYFAPCAALIADLPPLAAIPHWPPLQLARDLWTAEGIGPARQAVMDRVQGPKAVVLGRLDDRAAGVAFVAVHGDTAMLHALEVMPAFRRRGCAAAMLRQAAIWAQDHGAGGFSLVVTQANTGAKALYSSLGMQIVGHYHYRMA